MILVLNEWIFHDLLGENGEDIQQETAVFFRAFYRSHDRLALPREDRWIRKAYGLMNQADARFRNTSRQFLSLILNPDRAVDIRTIALGEVPEHLHTRVPEEDIYLVEAYMASDADCLVTTDQELYDALAGSELVSCRLRGEFLAGYHTG